MKLIKKIACAAAVLTVFAFAFNSCATNAPVVEYSLDGGEVFDDEPVEEPAVEMPPVEEPAPEAAPVEEKKDKKKAKKEEDTEPVLKSKRNIDVSFGIIRIKVKPSQGLFNISILNSLGKSIPALSTSNEYISTSFYLKAGKRIYKLNENSLVKSSAAVDYDNHAVLINYKIPNVADVNVTLKCEQSALGEDYDMVKVGAEVVNTGSKRADVALKIVLDTVLGETDRHHFYDNEGNAVRSEVSLRAVEGEKWYVSKNANASMQILPYAKDSVQPSMVAFANLSTLEATTWEPDMIAYRAFDTVLSYNNSAACIIWPEKRVPVTEKYNCHFYLAFAYDQDAPQGEKLVYSLKDNKDNIEDVTKGSVINDTPDKKGPEPIVFAPPKNENTEQEKKTYDFHSEPARPAEEGLADASSVTFQNKEEKDEFKPESPDAPHVDILPPSDQSLEQTLSNPRSDVKFDVSSLSKNQLSNEYIQNLLNRIAALEEAGDAVNRTELLQLNAELDAILQELRQ